MSDTEYPYVSLGDDGQPVVAGSLPLYVVVIDHDRGETAEAIADGYDVPVSAVHSGLAYFYDHVDVVRAEIDRRDRLAESLRGELEDPETVGRLRRAKALREAAARDEREAGERRRA